MNRLQSLNKVELTGVIGCAKMTETETACHVHFTVATNLAYKSADGSPVIETTWTNCLAMQKDRKNLEAIVKGKPIHLFGRLKNTRYIDCNGVEHTTTEIVVNKFEVLEGTCEFEMGGA